VVEALAWGGAFAERWPPMNPAVPLYLRIDREVRGPCDRAMIQRLIESEVITHDTEAALAATGPWVRLESFAEVAAWLPPKKVLGFKAREFAAINSGDAPPLEVSALTAPAKTEGRILRPSHPAELAAPLSAKPAATPNEVEVMVREVERIEALHAPPPPPPKKWRPSRRLKLVVALAVIGNALLVAIPVGYGAWGEMWTMLIWRGWVLLFNAGLVAVYFAIPKE
jgi:hypothetical protein